MMTPQPRSSSWSTKPITFQPTGPKPLFLRPLQNITVAERQRAELRCIIKGTPDTQVKWYSNGNPIEPSNNCIINFNRLSGMCTLELLEPSVHDSAQFTCVASNGAGSESSIAWLVVKPTNASEQQPLTDRPAGQGPRFTKLEPARTQLPSSAQTPLRLGTIESSKVDQHSPPSGHHSPQKVEIVRAYQKFPDSAPSYPAQEEPAEEPVQHQPPHRAVKPPSSSTAASYPDDVFEPVSAYILLSFIFKSVYFYKIRVRTNIMLI
jgi:hypothetical protein